MAVFQTTLWKLISGTLGLICLSLVATLGILLNNISSDCWYCPEKWVGYKCNCYFISTEAKTWKESRKFCVSHNSSLLPLENEDELAFMHSNQHFYWIGLSYNKERAAWFWEDDSPFLQESFPSIIPSNPTQCIIYCAMNSGTHEACENKNRYICKRQLIAESAR
ncbi:natural killer cells antigen CD94-like [Otolemur garnettii]|uniref:natural killer cells antigen CD94-like n=1 Tax=Otolemur garnettii TaxID=30611 RepID=UPI000C7F4DB2|nr:natural killer cells antigen CD94-like [Otolemur garnettii]